MSPSKNEGEKWFTRISWIVEVFFPLRLQLKNWKASDRLVQTPHPWKAISCLRGPSRMRLKGEGAMTCPGTKNCVHHFSRHSTNLRKYSWLSSWRSKVKVLEISFSFKQISSGTNLPKFLDFLYIFLRMQIKQVLSTPPWQLGCSSELKNYSKGGRWKITWRTELM